MPFKVKMKKQVKCPSCNKISGLGEVKRDINKEQLLAVCGSKPDAEEEDSGTEMDSAGEQPGYVVAMGNMLDTSLANIAEEVRTYVSIKLVKKTLQGKEPNIDTGAYIS